MEIVISIGGMDLVIHPSVLNWLGLCLIVGILFILLGKAFKQADPSKTPKGAVLVCESLVKTVTNIVSGNLKHRTKLYLPFFGTLIVLMAPSNLLGLLGLQPPTSNLSVNASIAIMIFLIIQYIGLKEKGIKGRLQELCDPIFLFFPLNIISDLALPVSLALRLFGNLLAGSIITTLVYGLMKSFMPGGVLGLLATPFLHAYFDIFSGLIQTYIFFTIASFFLNEAYVNEEE